MSGSYVVRFNGNRYTSIAGGSPTNVDTSANRTCLHTKAGSQKPNYRAIILAGGNATTVFNGTRQSLNWSSPNSYFAYKTSPAAGISWEGNNGLLNLWSPSVHSTGVSNGTATIASNRAITKLYAKVKEVQQQFAGGVFLGEFGKTVQTIKSPFQSIIKATKSYQKDADRIRRGVKHTSRLPGRNSDRAQRGLEEIRARYLEWTFGVTPLMGDVEDGSKALRTLVEKPEIIRFRATGEYTAQIAGAAPTGGTQAKMTWIKTQEISETAIISYYGAYKIMSHGEELSSQVGRVLTLSGLRPKQFLPTMWNLLPYSWLVDYVVNVGDMLEAATTDTSVISWISRTTRSFVRRRDIMTPQIEQSWNAYKTLNPSAVRLAVSANTGYHESYFFSVSRQPTVVPILVPSFKLHKASFRKVLNAVAVFARRR